MSPPDQQTRRHSVLNCGLNYQTRRFFVLRGDLALAGLEPTLQPPRSEIEARFEVLWQKTLEPALRAGQELSFADAEARMGPNPLLKAKRRYRECIWAGEAFIARISLDGGQCEHLWPASLRPDPSRLVVRFPGAAALARFLAAAEQARRDPAELAVALLVGFSAGAPGPTPRRPASGPHARPESAECVDSPTRRAAARS
ncbi:hypothetical protein [Nannocystis punicea]|uniref:Uncharacterized protein n=1 Tax=Nannocystis punicea TaxID=2995304 RepID=A0ABY7GS67_9BACT|nr:hypothetical protein [Nannocystis poenicansa]WAS89788.1 hypothetical protein O0S08_26655 [Nannocystis poenicansa]